MNDSVIYEDDGTPVICQGEDCSYLSRHLVRLVIFWVALCDDCRDSLDRVMVSGDILLGSEDSSIIMTDELTQGKSTHLSSN